MRWVEKEYNEGEERIVTKFLFFPLKIGKEVRWLEKATYLQRVCKKVDTYTADMYDYDYVWADVKFIDEV